jgi:hypothetical protein
MAGVGAGIADRKGWEGVRIVQHFELQSIFTSLLVLAPYPL